MQQLMWLIKETGTFLCLEQVYNTRSIVTASYTANVSQAYRPCLYANVTPADRLDVIDPNLKDSRGYDVDLATEGITETF